MALKAPRGLGVGGRALWRSVADVYELRADELRILEDAAREADLIETLSAGLEGQPLVVAGSMGQQVVHPLVSELRQHRSTLAGLLRQLKLPDTPGTLAPNQQRAAAQSRWAAAHGNGA